MKSPSDYTYPYSNTLSFDQQPSYSYSKFDGAKFLEAFFSTRDSFLQSPSPQGIKNAWDHSHFSVLVAKLSEIPDFARALEELELGMPQSPPDSNHPFHNYRACQIRRDSRNLEASNLLEALLCGFLHQSTGLIPQDEAFDYCVMFLHRFEIDRKIYSIYEQGLKNGKGEHDEVRLYLLVSVLFSICYILTKNLQFLSSSLKIGDLLTSPVFEVKFRQHAALGGLALRLERASVEEFLEKQSVKIAQH